MFHLEKTASCVKYICSGNSVVVELIVAQRGRQVSFIRYSGLAFLGFVPGKDSQNSRRSLYPSERFRVDIS